MLVTTENSNAGLKVKTKFDLVMVDRPDTCEMLKEVGDMIKEKKLYLLENMSRALVYRMS